MNHVDIHRHFETILPGLAEKTEEWFPCGRNAIRVRTNCKKEFVFSFNGFEDWKLETLENFIEHMQKGGISNA